MNEILRERLWRHIEALPEEQVYQVLDYIEFLTSKYARDPVRPAGSAFQRFGERLEDSLRANRVGYDAIRSTLNVVGVADRMVSGLAEAGRSILREVGATGEEPPQGSDIAQTSVQPGAERPRLEPPARRDIKIDD